MRRFLFLLMSLTGWLVGCTAPAAPPVLTPVLTLAVTQTVIPSEPTLAPATEPAIAEPTLAPTPAQEPPTGRFDGDLAMAHAQAQCDIGPRPVGSEALLATRQYIEETVTAAGWIVVRQDGEFNGVPIHNVIAVKGEGEARMIGAHYDTRPAADKDAQHPDQPIVGGNDGASGVAALLELARVLEVPEGKQVQLAFFDAEDHGNLDGWPFSVGARQLAEALGELPIARPQAMVLLDMMGDADLQLYREKGSDPALNDTIFGIAEELGFLGNGFFNEEKWTLIDDHLPFLEQGIPAVDLIDFDYPYWHTTEDTCDKLGVDSLYKVGRVMEVWVNEWR